MGGLAATIDWQRRVSGAELDPMLHLISHRLGNGVHQMAFEHAALAGTDAHPVGTSGTQLAVAGRCAIVGDLRLWNRDGLRSRAGGHSVTLGMTDPHLILEAYLRTGLDFLDDVDGDYAFVIWDDRGQRAIAVRDRFAVKPLFFERTTSGIRFASELKQLVATSTRSIEPCARSIAEYLTAQSLETRSTFFEGFERVRPAMALIADGATEKTVRYWNPVRPVVSVESDRDVASAYRHHLTESVARRLSASTAALGHLTGGLDSSAIAASAQILSDGNRMPAPFHTASAVFPEHAIDESEWINEIAEMQPFVHINFIPQVATIDEFERDMWIGDQPRVDRIRSMWTMSSRIAAEVGADLVLSGVGGDEVLSQDQLVIDRLRSGTPVERWRDMRAHIEWTGRSTFDVLDELARDAVPERSKRAIRKLLPSPSDDSHSLVRRELWESLADHPIKRAPTDFSLGSLTQDGVIAATQHPSLSWINEVQEAHYASRQMGLTQPYLDRNLVEYVASIPVRLRPYDGRSKTLTRVAFARFLPPSVVGRETKTVADDYLNVLLAQHGTHYLSTYPEVSDRALGFIEQAQYTRLLELAKSGPPTFHTREPLWRAWTLMAWLDGLGRYHK